MFRHTNAKLITGGTLSTNPVLRGAKLSGWAVVAAVFVMAASSWRPDLPPALATLPPAGHHNVPDLPPEAQAAMARILDQAIENARPGSASVGVEWLQQAQLTASDGGPDNAFGSAIALRGDTIVVGAVDHNASQGAAYVFTKPPGGWTTMTETARLTASDGVAEDWFGWSVAMDGDTIVVGSLGGTYGTSTKPGSAYVFVKPAGGWVDMTQTAKLTASDGEANDQFGYAVAISEDNIAVGAVFVSSTYVFVRPSGGWVTSTQTAKLTSTTPPGAERFGYALGMTPDTLIVGAIGISSILESAYVFVKPDGGWITTTQTARLTASDGEVGDGFGSSIAFDGSTAVISAPNDAFGASQQQGSAYVFVRPAGGWITSTQTAKLTASDGAAADWLGWSVALGADRVVLGAPFDNVGASTGQGSAYVFDQPPGGWADMTETSKLTASDGASNDGFGWSLALEGTTLAVGAHSDDIGSNTDQGSAYVFGLESGPTPTPFPSATPTPTQTPAPTATQTATPTATPQVAPHIVLLPIVLR